MRRHRAALAAAVVLTATGALVPGRVTNAAADNASRPNIVLVLADDMTTGDLAWMPVTQRVIAREGATFDSSFVNDPACCPSRVTMLTGRYAHNTGIFANAGTNGGFETAHARGLEQDTIATRLHAAGYRTGLFGKYLNGYPNGVAPEWVPPGWTRWVSPVAGDPYSQYDYWLNVDGDLRQHGHEWEDYGTTVLARAARTFVRTSARAGSPFFAALTVYAPHLPAVAAPQDTGKFTEVRAPRTPSYDQSDVTAAPNFVRALPHLGTRARSEIDQLFRERIRSLQAVDREVGALVRAARRAGVLDRTYFVFTSDNGFHLGQHRLPAGKYTAYDTDIHVPLLVRGPGIDADAHVSALTGNVDLAPTFAAMAGLRRRVVDDGRSLLGLAQDPSRESSWPRKAYLVEHRRAVGQGTMARADDAPLEPSDPEVVPEAGDAIPTAPAPAPGGGTTVSATARGMPPEPTYPSADASALWRTHGVPDYDAVRTPRWLWVEYADGQRELYDLRADPDELVNLAGRGHVSVEKTLHRRLELLRTCAGASCLGPTSTSHSGAG